MAEQERFIGPLYNREYEGITKSSQRLPKVIEFLARDDITTLSPLETHIIENAVQRFLDLGFIGNASALEVSSYTDPPEKTPLGDFRKTVLVLVEKGFLVKNSEDKNYSLGIVPTTDDDAASKAGKVLARRGASKGGQATAANRTSEERSSAASRASNTRWHPETPQA